MELIYSALTIFACIAGSFAGLGKMYGVAITLWLAGMLITGYAAILSYRVDGLMIDTIFWAAWAATCFVIALAWAGVFERDTKVIQSGM